MRALSLSRGWAQIAEVERFPTNYYEDGIDQLHATLQIRQRLAFEHWNGNTGFSFEDIVRLMVESRIGGTKSSNNQQ
jgi:hypothetical protein